MENVVFSRLSRQNIRSLKPYESKEISCKVKLNANESPYFVEIQPPKELLGKLNRYPDSGAKELRKTISKNYKISPDNILLGNGSDELIYYLITTFGGPVLFPSPTFSMYEIISRSLGEKDIKVPLSKDFDIDIAKMLAAIKKYKPKLIFLNSPNNPTGNCFSADKILKITETSECIVIIDEAYQPFSSKKGLLPLFRDYKNLAILRTLSKIGFASLRVGFLIADKALISEVNKVRLPFNLNAISQAMAVEAFKSGKIIESHIKAIVSERERLLKELDSITSITPYHSEANFILFKVDSANTVFQNLIKEGVLIRNITSYIEDSLRVTIGTPEENDIFLTALKKVTLNSMFLEVIR